MNIKTNDKLIFAIRSVIDSADRLLNGITRHGNRAGGIDQLPEVYDIGNELSWRASDWTRGSYLRQWGVELARRHEAMTQYVALLDDGVMNVVDVEMLTGALDAGALHLQKQVFSQCMETIFRGTESSSNPMTLLGSVEKVAAAKFVLEAICGVSSWYITSDEMITDIYGGLAERESHRKEQMRKIVRKIRYGKRDRCDGGGYYAIAYNADGENVSTVEIIATEVTRKADALAHIAIFTKAQRDSGNQLSIIVEEMN